MSWAETRRTNPPHAFRATTLDRRRNGRLRRFPGLLAAENSAGRCHVRFVALARIGSSCSVRLVRSCCTLDDNLRQRLHDGPDLLSHCQSLGRCLDAARGLDESQSRFEFGDTDASLGNDLPYRPPPRVVLGLDGGDKVGSDRDAFFPQGIDHFLGLGLLVRLEVVTDGLGFIHAACLGRGAGSLQEIELETSSVARPQMLVKPLGKPGPSRLLRTIGFSLSANVVRRRLQPTDQVCGIMS
jgi:hypothetical protein